VARVVGRLHVDVQEAGVRALTDRLGVERRPIRSPRYSTIGGCSCAFCPSA
jgi:hypothetical protein